MKPKPEDDDADLNHGARTEAVDQPAERRAEQGAFDRLQSRAAGKAVLLQPRSSESTAT